MRCLNFAPVTLVVVASTVAAATMSRADTWPPVEVDFATVQIEKALATPTRLEFIETPLADVTEFLKDLHGIEIQLDVRSLEDVGIGSDTPITKNLKGVTLRSALELMLRDLDLTYAIRDEVLLITTPEAVEGYRFVQAYKVGPLLADDRTTDDLIEVLLKTGPWEEEGAARIEIKSFGEVLVVKTDYRNQHLVARLLHTLGTGIGARPEKAPIVNVPVKPMR